MSNVRLVLTDLDGTVVLPESNIVSSEVAAAIREGEEQGIGFAAVTGRPFWMAQDLLKTLGFEDPCIFEGGALIMNPVTEEVLWSKTVPIDTTKQAVVQLVEYASSIEYGDGVKDAQEVEVDTIEKPALSVWASVPAERADELVAELCKLPEVSVHANAGPGGDFSRTGIQVTHYQADKEHAVVELLRLSGVDRAHTLAIGDGNNDLPLLKNAAIKIAMGNASETLKTAADFVVDDVAHDGFAFAVRYYALQPSARAAGL